MDDQQLGELIGAVRAIKENTDRIPALAETVAVHEAKLNDVLPKVEQQGRVVWGALAVAALFSAVLCGAAVDLVKLH